jgi:hypothetical protein
LQPFDLLEGVCAGYRFAADCFEISHELACILVLPIADCQLAIEKLLTFDAKFFPKIGNPQLAIGNPPVVD